MIMQKSKITELGLWAIESLMMEQGKKSWKRLSKRVYDLVKSLYDSGDHENYFWSLLVTCTAYSKVNCMSAHNDFYEFAMDTALKSTPDI